jgi:hypothetical protein
MPGLPSHLLSLAAKPGRGRGSAWCFTYEVTEWVVHTVRQPSATVNVNKHKIGGVGLNERAVHLTQFYYTGYTHLRCTACSAGSMCIPVWIP